MRLEPVGHRVVVKPEKLEERDPTYARASKAGIALPDSDDKRRREAGSDRGIVISVGPNAFREFNLAAGVDNIPWCKTGDRILYAKHAGKWTENPDNADEQWLILNDEDVVGVLKDE